MKLNLCSGQRPFGDGWTNVDSQAKWNPDVLCDCSNMPMFADGSADMIVIHHGLEHFGCGEADAMIRECNRILRPKGSLIVCVPNILELVKAWLRGKIDDQIFLTGVYGAYAGDEADRHRWSFTEKTLAEKLWQIGDWTHVKLFDDRKIQGADISKDFWILSIEAIK